nr:phosphatase PAP2 family protein [Geodermatophilus sabuli]
MRREATGTARRRALTAVCGGLGVLTALGAGVVTGAAPQIRVDEAVSQALYAGDERATVVTVVLEVLTTPGVVWFRVLVFLPVLFWLGARRAWWTAAWVIAANVGVSPLTVLLKEAVGRVRPAFEDGGLHHGGLSFPSGHSSGVATLVTVGLVLAWPRLTPRRRRLAVAGGVGLAVLVGLTRIWLGVHFPSDVVGGWALGVAWSLAVALLAGALPGGRAALPAQEKGADPT